MKTAAFLSSVLLALASASPIAKRQDVSSSASRLSSGVSSLIATSTGSASAAGPTGSAPASPSSAAGALNDTQILQFALTLEHLENAFYNASIGMFSEQDFQDAGYNDTSRDQLYSIGQDEAAHVAFLTAALGNSSVSPCEYDLSSVTDVQSFLATAQVLEGVGVSAYLGAAKLIMDKTYLEAAGSILTVEARHQSYINSQVNASGNAIPGAFDTPLNATEVYSLAAPFIKSCPQNSTLPFKAFPAATVTSVSTSGSGASNSTAGSNANATTDASNSTNAVITPGSQVSIKYDNAMTQSQDGKNASEVYVAIVSGPSAPTFVKLPADGTVTLPQNITGGQFYAIVTSSNETVSDDTALAIGAGQVFAPLPKAPAATAASSSAATSSATASATGVTSSAASAATSMSLAAGSMTGGLASGISSVASGVATSAAAQSTA